MCHSPLNKSAYPRKNVCYEWIIRDRRDIILLGCINDFYMQNLPSESFYKFFPINIFESKMSELICWLNIGKIISQTARQKNIRRFIELICNEKRIHLFDIWLCVLRAYQKTRKKKKNEKNNFFYLCDRLYIHTQ